MRLRPPSSTRRILLCATLAAAFAASAHAQTLTAWNGEGNSGSWFNDLNWAGGVRPPSNALSDVLVASATSGTVVTTMTLSSTRTIRTLTFDNAAGQLPATLNLDTNLTPAAGVTPTNRTLTVHGGIVVDSTTTVRFRGRNGATSYVLGNHNTFNVIQAAGQLSMVFDSNVETNNLGAFVISGGFSITKTGPGSVLMGTEHIHTGGYILEAGRLRTNGSSLQTSGVITRGPFGLGPLTLRGGILQAFGTATRVYHNAVVIEGDVILGGLTPDGATLTAQQTISALGGGSTTVAPGIHTLDTQSPVVWNQALTGEGDLVKTGDASLTLGGINAYAGDIEVAVGSLVLNNFSEYRFTLGPAGATNTITGAGSATYDGRFRIDPSAVTADGSWQLVDVASETYGPDFTLALIDDTAFTATGAGLYTAGAWTYDTATGVLTRDSSAPVATALETWRDQNFGNSANTDTAADAADPDGDGIPNLLEYALGLAPNIANPGALPAAQLTGPALQLAFSRIADPALLYTVEASSTLAPDSWSSVWTSTGTANTAGPVTVTDPAPLADHPRRFLRLRVSY